jgi:predicted neutral ceramidase superfamily lipid hydrolase
MVSFFFPFLLGFVVAMFVYTYRGPFVSYLIPYTYIAARPSDVYCNFYRVCYLYYAPFLEHECVSLIAVDLDL